MPDAASGDERTAAPGPAWLIAFVGLAALANAMGIGRFAFTPILPLMQGDVGLSVADAGWLASANYVGYLAGALSAIRIRLRPVVVIRASLLVIGASTLAMGVDHRFFDWLVLRAIAGIASAWVLVFVSAWALERLALLERASLSGTVYAGVGAGIALAGIACLIVTGVHAGSTAAWLTLGVVSILLTGLIWPLVRAGPSSAPSGPQEPRAASRKWNAEQWRLVFCYGGFGFGYIIPATFLPLMAKRIIPDPQLFGWAWPVFGAAAIVSTLVAARRSQSLSLRAIWIAAHFVMALGLVVPLVVQGLPGILSAALLVGSTFMVITMVGLQEGRRLGGPDPRVLMAGMTSGFALGQILGPMAASLLVQPAGSLGAALLLAAAILVITAILLMKPGVAIESAPKRSARDG